MKVAIIGAGAMGGLYGGVLMEKGHDVYLIDVDEKHVQAINENGLKIHHVKTEESKNYELKAYTDATNIKEKMDLIILLVKTYVTEEAVKQNKHLVSDDTIFLTLQNGAGNIEKIEQYIDKNQIIAGTTSTAGFITEPGVVEHTGDGGTHIGEIDGTVTDRIEMVHDLFVDDRLGESIIEENVMSLIWEKLIANCGINPIGALTYLRNGDNINDEEKQWLYDQITQEALQVAEAEGIKLSFNDSSGIKKVAEATAANQTSMLIDVKNERKTEIEAINGEIVRKAKEHGLQAPVNETLLNLVLLREKHYLQN